MWTSTTRRQYSRDGLRYETDLTDAEWALIAAPARALRPRTATPLAHSGNPERNLLRAARRHCLAAVAL